MSESVADRMQAACEKYMQTHRDACTGVIAFTPQDWKDAGNSAETLCDQAGRGCAAACNYNDVVTKLKGDKNGGTVISTGNDINSNVPKKGPNGPNTI